MHCLYENQSVNQEKIVRSSLWRDVTRFHWLRERWFSLVDGRGPARHSCPLIGAPPPRRDAGSNASQRQSAPSMVSYYNPLAMYRHQQQSPAPPPGPQFHPHQGPGAAAHGWYSPPTAAAYHPQPPPQQFLSPCQEEPWHHHAAHHMFQPEWGGGGPGGPGGGTPDFAAPIGAGGVVLEEPQLPSPPITVSSSELSSPGAALSPPQHRPMQVRSPFEWMKKPSYQSQPNPGECE